MTQITGRTAILKEVSKRMQDTKEILHCSKDLHCPLLKKAKIHKQVTTSKETFLWLGTTKDRGDDWSHIFLLPRLTIQLLSRAFSLLEIIFFGESIQLNCDRSHALHKLLRISNYSKCRVGFRTLFTSLMSQLKPRFNSKRTSECVLRELPVSLLRLGDGYLYQSLLGTKCDPRATAV